MCLINDYSLIADLHIFVYELAECASISLECTKVKLSILNNFDAYFKLRQFKIHIIEKEVRKKYGGHIIVEVRERNV